LLKSSGIGCVSNSRVARSRSVDTSELARLGRRSGDQFWVYVCDRLVIPSLSADELRAVGDGALSLDARTREFIRGTLTNRSVVVPDSESAYRIERLVQSRALDADKPILNLR
jgi:hypothetical protein